MSTETKLVFSVAPDMGDSLSTQSVAINLFFNTLTECQLLSQSADWLAGVWTTAANPAPLSNTNRTCEELA